MNMASQINKRTFLSGCLLAGAATMATRPLLAQQNSQIKLALNWIPSIDDAGIWIAIDRGYFQEQAVDFSYVPGGPNAPNSLVAVAAGSAQVAVSDWFSLVDATTKGNDLVALCAMFPVLPIGLLSLPGKPIRKPEDILDKRILIQDPHNKTMIDAILAIHNLPARYEVVQSGYSADPLFAGDGDAYFCYLTNQPLALEAAGKVAEKDFVLTTLQTLGLDLAENLLVMRRDFVESNKPAVQGFVSAVLKGWQDNNNDPSIAPKLVVDMFGADFGLELPLEQKKNAVQIPLTTSPDGGRLMWVSPRQIDLMYKVAAMVGGKDLPPPERLFDRSFLDAAASKL